MEMATRLEDGASAAKMLESASKLGFSFGKTAQMPLVPWSTEEEPEWWVSKTCGTAFKFSSLRVAALAPDL